jgi:polyisoprenoid-binding protein YceI
MATTWNLDPAHSEVQFKVKHLMISTVTGYFTELSSTVEADNDDFTNARVDFTAQIASISTGQEMRDNHLKSDDFFNAEAFPTMTFRSTGLAKTSGNLYTLTGDLTIRNVTKTVTLHVEFGGMMKDPYGNIKAGFEVSGVLNRKEFGLMWNGVTEAGGVVVSDEVKIYANVQYAKQAA